MIKKILGFIFIVIAIILSLAFLSGIPNTIKLFLALLSNSSGYSIGYFIGNFLITILLLLLSIYLFKLGVNWVKNRPKNSSKINEIGKN